jgi:Zn finger protein HypA/HybF involved in hydrogenase expression
MYCEDCRCDCDMLEPTEENPERRFECPKCGTVYVAVDFGTEEELRLN